MHRERFTSAGAKSPQPVYAHNTRGLRVTTQEFVQAPINLLVVSVAIRDGNRDLSFDATVPQDASQVHMALREREK